MKLEPEQMSARHISHSLGGAQLGGHLGLCEQVLGIAHAATR